MARPMSAPIRHGHKLGWLYATATVAAMILVTVFILWSRVDDGKVPMVKLWDDGTPSKTDDTPNVASVVQVAHVDPDDYTPAGGGDADRQLTSAEGDLSTLSALTDSMPRSQDTVTP